MQIIPDHNLIAAEAINQLMHGLPIGHRDSNGRDICCGDTVRYEYKNGITADGRHAYPFATIVDESHETVMQYQLNAGGGGFFLDLPGGINITMVNSLDTVKWYVKEVKNEQ